jgi:hypothetical protein
MSLASLCKTLDMDLLLSAGQDHKAQLHVPDIGAQFSYSPGCLIGILGHTLPHSVPDWGEGERICFAHFFRDNVHQRLGIQRPSLTQMDYLRP